MKAFLAKLFDQEDLSKEEAQAALATIMQGRVPAEILGAFLGALRGKGESDDEITGLAQAMRAHAVRLPIQRQDLLDTCGTGGSGTHTFNISTIAGFILAAAGFGVVKHGNRSISSQCGSADLLEAMGIAIDLPPERVAASVDDIGFGFLFARSLHPAMQHLASVRVSLGVRTVFNLLGPLTNPAFARCQVMGVFAGERLEQMARVLGNLGVAEAMVVHGSDGMDEVTLTGKTSVAHVIGKEVQTYELAPSDFGMQPCSLAELRGGGISTNVAIAKGILSGELRGSKRDIVVANAACALKVAGKVPDLTTGVALATELLDNGAAQNIVNRLREFR